MITEDFYRDLFGLAEELGFHPPKLMDIQEKNSEILSSFNIQDLKMLIAGMMGGIELAKYDGIDFTPPEGAREAAKRALDVRETKPPSQRGMTPVGIARARDLQNGVKLSPDTVRRMLNFLTRHEVDKKGATWDEQGKGWQAWHGWGGDAGYAWARKVVKQMEARDSKELARPVSQTPAPPKERIKGSKENPEGTASTRSKAGDIEISSENEEALKNKIAEFKDKHPARKAPTLGALKKVFRRGAGAFSTSFRPTITGGKPNSRNAWAMARVNKFLKMAGGGEVKDSYRKADGDLLEERFDCGTGAGGFKEGNTCAGGGEETKISNKIEKNRQFIDDVDKESKNNKEKIIFVKDGKKISETYGVDDRADLTEEQKNLLKSSSGEITTIHNHPQESIPSSLDIGLFAGSGGEHIISTPTSIYKINIDKKTEDEARNLSENYASVNYKIQKELNSYLSDRFPRKIGGGAGIDGFSYRNKGEFEKAKNAEKKISESIFSDFAKTNGFAFDVIDKKS